MLPGYPARLDSLVTKGLAAYLIARSPVHDEAWDWQATCRRGQELLTSDIRRMPGASGNQEFGGEPPRSFY